MGHINSRSYLKLQKRLDDAPQGAPESESLYKILKVFFTKEEAGLVSVLPMNFFTIEKAAKLWKKKEGETEEILNKLAGKGILFDFSNKKIRAFIVTPTMAGFFEFAIMRTDGKFDHQILSELFYQYINTEEDYIKKVFTINPPLDRIFVHEEVIQKKDKTIVLDFERASKIIKEASFVTVSNCYCRHKKEHLGTACDNPQKVCLTLNKAAESLAKHGIAEKISNEEGLKILKECKGLGLVQLGDNIQNDVNWICNCCSCCCDGLSAYRRLGYNPKIESNFISNPSNDKCTGCNICVKKCPVEAIKLKSNNNKFYIEIDKQRCIGCGVCARFCSFENIKMERREKLNFIPIDTFERYIVGAIDKGEVQNLLFDNYTLWTHEMLRRFLGIILNLKPAKRLLATKQMRSIFMNTLTKTGKYELFDKIFNNGRKVKY
ncbi:4Fe-4S binding protein [Candidatus Falkowbacteria bacterium]|jgi:Pyruvate/2-oxoacid:ferredoxin oxidoreductase delta subunit|nr:4Fe-4S binding protein [Candidatus Falkowbacteria bacterium]MBT4432734.1 4Fe-4S binding protein [Candidatus Falkowbacteria bacterium]